VSIKGRKLFNTLRSIDCTRLQPPRVSIYQIVTISLKIPSGII
jgi:hypothetical protein